jgi:hypothetical protein
MIGETRSIFKRGYDISFFKIRIISQNLRSCRSARQELQDIGNANPLTANAGTAAQHIRVGRDAIEMVRHRAVSTSYLLTQTNIADFLAKITRIDRYDFGAGGGAVK